MCRAELSNRRSTVRKFSPLDRPTPELQPGEPEGQAPEWPADGADRRARRSDLLRMHAYRDAVRRSSGGYVVYPVTERADYQQYHELLPGLGAFPLSEYLEQEFDWLRGPYEDARERGWLESDRPSPKQIRYLQDLVEETGADLPEEVFDSKQEVSAWIDRLQDEIQPILRLTDIHEAEVNGVDVHRFRLYRNRGLPDDEHQHLIDLGFRYVAGGEDHPPGYQYQRQDRSVVEEVREEVRRRFSRDEVAEEFVFEDGGPA